MLLHVCFQLRAHVPWKCGRQGCDRVDHDLPVGGPPDQSGLRIIVRIVSFIFRICPPWEAVQMHADVVVEALQDVHHCCSQQGNGLAAHLCCIRSGIPLWPAMWPSLCYVAVALHCALERSL